MSDSDSPHDPDDHIRRGYPDFTDAQVEAYKEGYAAGWEYGRNKTPITCRYTEEEHPDLVKAFNLGAWTGDDQAVGRK